MALVELLRDAPFAEVIDATTAVVGSAMRAAAHPADKIPRERTISNVFSV